MSSQRRSVRTAKHEPDVNIESLHLGDIRSLGQDKPNFKEEPMLRSKCWEMLGHSPPQSFLDMPRTARQLSSTNEAQRSGGGGSRGVIVVLGIGNHDQVVDVNSGGSSAKAMRRYIASRAATTPILGWSLFSDPENRHPRSHAKAFPLPNEHIGSQAGAQPRIWQVHRGQLTSRKLGALLFAKNMTNLSTSLAIVT